MDKNSSDYGIEYLLINIPDEIIMRFQLLKTHEKRFTLILEYVVGNADVWANVENEKKTSKHSMRLRESGNKSYMNGQYDKAVQEYTKSILYAVDASEESALAYANRSAALFKLEKYEDCIKDIGRALNLSYPDRLKTKLYKRQGECLIKLGRPGADSSFTQALLWLDKSTLSEDDRKETKSELKILISTPYPTVKSPEKTIKFLAVEILQPNSDIPCASDAITVKYSEKHEGYMVATRKIRPGEVLVNEKPFCKRLRPQNVHTACSECMQDSSSMIPCPFCVYAAYCSEACKDRAWDEYHEVECPVTGLLLSLNVDDAVGMGLRMAIIAAKKGRQLDILRQEVTAADVNTDPAAVGYCKDGKIHSDQFLSIHPNFPSGLVERFTGCQQIRGVLWIAVSLCFLAKETKMFGNKLALNTLAKNPDTSFIGGLIFKQLAFGQSWSFNTGNWHALMAVSKFANHSCYANTIGGMQGDRMIIIAAHPIEEGEQVLVNNSLDHALLTKGQRMPHFKFKCNCLACTQDWPLARDQPSYRDQQIPLNNMRKINTAVRKFRKCKFELAQDRRAVNALMNLIETLFAFTMKPCKELALATLLLKLCYMEDNGEGTTPNEKRMKDVNFRFLYQTLSGMSDSSKVHHR